MALEEGDRVMFTKYVGGIMRPFVRKGTEGTVTDKVGWGQYQITLADGRQIQVSEDEIRQIGGKKSDWW